MVNQYGVPIPLPIVLIGLFIAAAVAILAVVFNKRLKQIPEYIETVFHETGHALSGVPLNGGMPTRIDFFDGAEAQVEYSDYGSGYLGRWFSTISGYGFPILYGFALIWLTFTKTLHLSTPLLACGVLFCLLILMGRLFPAFRVMFSLGFHGCLIWLLFFPPVEGWGGTVSGFTAQLILVGFVGFALLLGSWRHIFTIAQPESLRTFLILFSLFVVLGIFHTFPALTEISGFVLFGLGVFLMLSGVKTIALHRSSADDFRIMAEELGGTPLTYFVQFVLLFPVALLAVIRVLWVATFL